jgi:hypothetical protein
MIFTIEDQGEAESVIRKAKRAARREKNRVEIYHEETNELLMTVLPDGHVDATWEGSRFLAIVPQEIGKPETTVLVSE